jgi:hypothetical protein
MFTTLVEFYPEVDPRDVYRYVAEEILPTSPQPVPDHEPARLFEGWMAEAWLAARGQLSGASPCIESDAIMHMVRNPNFRKRAKAAILRGLEEALPSAEADFARNAGRPTAAVEPPSGQELEAPLNPPPSPPEVGVDQAKGTNQRLTGPPAKKRLTAKIGSPMSVKRMEAYLQSTGMGQTEFATQVGTTDRTLRAFRRNGKVRRDIFNNIAKAMGTTREELLKPD